MYKSGNNSINNQFMLGDLISNVDIMRNGLKWCSVDKIHLFLNSKDAFVVNTDTSYGGGIHWIVLFVRNGICYIIDSLGKNNKRDNEGSMIKQILDFDLKPKIYDKGAFQYVNNSMCGWFSIFVAKLINYNKNVDIFKMIYNIFGSRPDDNDIMILIRSFGLDGNDKLDRKFDWF